MWTPEELTGLEIGSKVSKDQVIITRRPDTKTGKPVYRVYVDALPTIRGGTDVWSTRNAAKWANTYQNIANGKGRTRAPRSYSK